jgi:hypothetical protein
MPTKVKLLPQPLPLTTLATDSTVIYRRPLAELATHLHGSKFYPLPLLAMDEIHQIRRYFVVVDIGEVMDGYSEGKCIKISILRDELPREIL